MAVRNTQSLLSHLSELGFSVNREKSILTPTHCIEYLGLKLDAVSYRAYLSQSRVEKFVQQLALFHRGNTVTLRACLRISGLMASAISVVPQGLLKMRDFQRWVLSLRLDSRRHLNRKVKVTPDCVIALRHWKTPLNFKAGRPMGAVSMRRTVTTDTSLRGWGAVYEGRTVNGVWPLDLQQAHINYLALLAIFLALKLFLPFLRGHHVLADPCISVRANAVPTEVNHHHIWVVADVSPFRAEKRHLLPPLPAQVIWQFSPRFWSSPNAPK
ncbi:hypothetical protein SKAU_G00277010 [Synaphobranchus kaupii]|uniref:Reverse transcriptase n=1 Tax=Synaphobranchus kaupii TaxID=118154 RepID=A0A9Q1IQZ0_SYNKA|nr:hypothetical protein SKAU_G00277010 [Synaphobranchus kaupii]